MVSAAAGLTVGSNNAIARRGMHWRFIEACVRIATAAAKLGCPMASLSLFLSGTIFGFRRSPRFPGLLACVCCTTNHDWRSRLLVAQNHPLRIFSAVALKNAYSLGSEGYP